MPVFVALLRAVNVGGTGKLPMAELKAMCEAEGHTQVQTYIASGNVVFGSKTSAPVIRAALEARLQLYMGKAVGVFVRTAAELHDVWQANPFPDAPASRVMVHFLHDCPPLAALEHLKGRQREELKLGHREIYVHYPEGLGSSKLVIPAAKTGTGRNLNTVAKLAELASKVSA
ncbi:MAG: DUF1697 domain-containing protein [Verrucomicrobiales bacterium]|nr:DUF1697 domain-containing protein [Verrucomicrobiales bacterium]